MKKLWALTLLLWVAPLFGAKPEPLTPLPLPVPLSYCPKQLPCLIEGPWNFIGGLYVNGVLVTPGSGGGVQTSGTPANTNISYFAPDGNHITGTPEFFYNPSTQTLN